MRDWRNIVHDGDGITGIDDVGDVTKIIFLNYIKARQKKKKKRGHLLLRLTENYGWVKRENVPYTKSYISSGTVKIKNLNFQFSDVNISPVVSKLLGCHANLN